MNSKKLKKLALVYEIPVQLLKNNKFCVITIPDITDESMGAFKDDLILFDENNAAEKLETLNKHFAIYNKESGSDLSVDLYYFHPVYNNKIDKMIKMIKKITKKVVSVLVRCMMR